MTADYNYNDEAIQPHCNICGQFAAKEKWEGEFVRWRLRCVSTDWEGITEHD